MPMNAAMRLVSASALICLAACSGGMDFPPEAPVPDGATVLVTDDGADDDDGSIRVRVQVIEAPRVGRDALYGHYRSAYPGWITVTDGLAGLCLTKHEGPGQVSVVEVSPYQGSRVPAGPGRWLVANTRTEMADEPCGMADGFIAMDLLPPGLPMCEPASGEC